MDSFNINLDSMVSAQPTTAAVDRQAIQNGHGADPCPNCSKLEEQFGSEQAKMASNAQFLMNYVENTEKVVAVKSQLEDERDQLKRQLEEKDVYIESLKLEETNLRLKLSKALDDNQPLLYELNSIRTSKDELYKSREEFVVKAASLEATLKQVQDLMRIKDEELLTVRQKSETISQRNNELLSQYNDTKNKLTDLKEKFHECSSELTERRQHDKECSKFKRSSLTNLHRATKLCNDLASVLMRHEKTIPSHLKRTLETVRCALKLTDVNESEFMDTDFFHDDLVNESVEATADVENVFVFSPTKTESVPDLVKIPAKSTLTKQNIDNPRSLKVKHSARLLTPTVKFTDAQMKARETWSGGKPSALQTLVRPIEVQQRSQKSLSLTPITIQKVACNETKKEVTSSVSIPESLSIAQILSFFKSFLTPPLSPIPRTVEDNVQFANVLQETVAAETTASKIESCFDISTENILTNIESEKESIQETMVALTDRDDENFATNICPENVLSTDERRDDDSDNDEALCIDESVGISSTVSETLVVSDVKHLVSTSETSPTVLNEDLAASSVRDEVTVSLSADAEPVATTSEMLPVVASNASKIISFEKEFENEMRKILGVMALEKCFTVNDLGELKFSTNASKTLRKVHRLISSCDKKFFDEEFFKSSVKNLRFFLDLPDKEAVVNENAVHKITMILYVLANLSSYIDIKSGQIVINLFKSYLECDRPFMQDLAVTYSLSFALLRLSAMFPYEMKPLLEKWFHDGQRKIDPTLRSQYEEFLSHFDDIGRP